MTVDGSLLGCVTLGGWDGGCHRDTSGRSRIANGFTGGTVLQVSPGLLMDLRVALFCKLVQDC